MEVLYKHNELVHNFKTPREVLPLVISWIDPKSILDAGCGIGTWLKVADDLGIHDLIGIDGSYVDKSLLKIDNNKFIEKDFRIPFNLNRKFDLVISLEVAEHLPEESAKDFIDSLCKHGDNILFSAAVPGQGGQNHLNEQWPEYWGHLFMENGLVAHDILRPIFWNNPNVQFWYKQNMILYSRKNIIAKSISTQSLNSYVHPSLYFNKIREIEELKSELEACILSKKKKTIKEKFMTLLKGKN